MTPKNSSWMDRAFNAFAHPIRREVLCLLHEFDGTSTDIDQLTEALVDVLGNPHEHEMRVQLHHQHLPNLQTVGFIEYDQRSGDIRYQSHEFVERILRSQVLECSEGEKPKPGER